MEKEYPRAITSSISMTQPNESIPIYNGEFVLVKKNSEIKMEGEIWFGWFPNISVKFKGIVQSSNMNSLDWLTEDDYYELLIKEHSLGSALITNYFISNYAEIQGLISENAVFGDKTIPVTKVIFSIPNLSNLFGLPVKKMKTNIVVRPKVAILVFDNQDYSIIIDKVLDSQKKFESLKSSGGYIILYYGEIIKKKGAIELQELKNLMDSFMVFVSFLNGRRTSPMFLRGIHEEEVLWTDYTGYKTEPYKYVVSWLSHTDIKGLNGLWNEFSTLWKDENDRDFINSVIHWYVEANLNSGYIEGSIIMIQTALELLYNWLIIEKKKMIIGKDGERLSASNKIRLLLSQVNAKKCMSHTFENLKAFIRANDSIIDEVDAFVYFRNAIVHSQEEKRKELSKISGDLKDEIQQLGLWYIEVSLLYILKFEGKYYNRCSGKLLAGDGEEDSPYLRN